MRLEHLLSGADRKIVLRHTFGFGTDSDLNINETFKEKDSGHARRCKASWKKLNDRKKNYNKIKSVAII